MAWPNGDIHANDLTFESPKKTRLLSHQNADQQQKSIYSNVAILFLRGIMDTSHTNEDLSESIDNALKGTTLLCKSNALRYWTIPFAIRNTACTVEEINTSLSLN